MRQIATVLKQLSNGSWLSIRALQPADREVLAAGMRSLSAHSRQARFLHGRFSFPSAELDYLTELDQRNHIGLIAAVLREERWHNAGIGRAIRLSPHSDVAEMALAILDEYQGIGIGTCLLRYLAELAVGRGMTYFQAVYASENKVIDRIVRRFGGVITERGDGVDIRIIKTGQILCDLNADLTSATPRTLAA
ncbi:MAG TPA: GNAT family N-acetyltransferase [Dongiaceae bacterium]|nr:GNAT family N-acetyltransferase [Dongiaceae bacterium]